MNEQKVEYWLQVESLAWNRMTEDFSTNAALHWSSEKGVSKPTNEAVIRNLINSIQGEGIIAPPFGGL